MIDVFLLFVTAQLAGGMPEPAPADIAWVADEGFCEPETVLPLPDNTLLVSNVCDFRTAGDGYLSLLDADGRVIDAKHVDGLDSPLGMALVDQRLYVVDSNTVRIFDWPSYEQRSQVSLSTSVANDIAVANDGTMYVTDTGRGEVAVVSPDAEYTLLVGSERFSGANGVHVHGDTLYVGGERLWRVDLNDETVTTLGPDWLIDIDGIEMEPDGILQITPVGGPLVRLTDAIEVLGGEGVSSANHGYAERLGLALIPTGFDNTVIAIRLSRNDSATDDASD